MSYEKQNWATGDIITADKLNHMENGIAGADNSIYVLDLNNLQVPEVDGESSEGRVTVRYDGSDLQLSNCYIADIPDTAKVFILSVPTEGCVLVSNYGVMEVSGYNDSTKLMQDKRTDRSGGQTFCLADDSCIVWYIDDINLFPSTATFALLNIGGQ